MASIQKRRKGWDVIYRYKDEEGKSKQKWERFNSYEEAVKRKHEVEYQQDTGVFVPPSNMTVKELMEKFMQLYGLKTWSFRTYEGYESKIRNYINPGIGNMAVRDVTTLIIDTFYDRLLKQNAVGKKGERSTYKITPKIVSEIHKCLRCAFNQAVAWEIIARNPFNNAKPPKYTPKEKVILDSDEILKVIELSEDMNLTVALHLGFACTMRIGEILGLTWDCVDVSDSALENNSCHLLVSKELQRINIEYIDKLQANEIFFRFPNIMPNSKSVLILKKPKTESSSRKIWIPRTAAESLRVQKANQAEQRDLFGDIYTDYNMVVAGNTGYPVEHRIIHKAMNKLIAEHGLPKVVFHSLRHSSTTAKLKLTNGDLKATQGDTGHANAAMIMDLYAHIQDDDRVETARKFEREIYGRGQQSKTGKNELEVQRLLQEALASPEIVATLAKLVAAQQSVSQI